MKIFQNLFKARDKPKDTLGGSRYNFFFGSTSAVQPVSFLICAGVSRLLLM